MEYNEFIDRVAERAGVDREHARVLTHATLQVLADRISGGEDVDLAIQLPEELARLVQKKPQKLPEKYGFPEFVERVHQRAANVPREEVEPGIRAVMLTLRDAVGAKEFRDTLAQLPGRFREMVGQVGAPEAGEPTAAEAAGDRTAGAATVRGQRSGPPAPAAGDDALVQQTAERTGVSPEAAAALTRATLDVLGDLIGGAQAHDLARRLPDTSAEWLDEEPETPPENFGVEGFVSRVRDI